MDAQGFCEVETPLLWAPTPKARASSSCLHVCNPGVLRAAPEPADRQATLDGRRFDRYYQIARCMRDEDCGPIANSSSPNSISKRASSIKMTSSASSRSRVGRGGSGDRRTADDIPSMTWTEALDRYGTDKPDLRFEMLLHDLSDVFAVTEVKAFSAPTVKAMRVRGARVSRARLDELTIRPRASARRDSRGSASRRRTGLPLAKFLNETESAPSRPSTTPSR